jgi:hypothetical protein
MHTGRDLALHTRRECSLFASLLAQSCVAFLSLLAQSCVTLHFLLTQSCVAFLSLLAQSCVTLHFLPTQSCVAFLSLLAQSCVTFRFLLTQSCVAFLSLLAQSCVAFPICRAFCFPFDEPCAFDQVVTPYPFLCRRGSVYAAQEGGALPSSVVSLCVCVTVCVCVSVCICVSLLPAGNSEYWQSTFPLYLILCFHHCSITPALIALSTLVTAF